MKILITNTDGIFSPGTAELAKVLSHFGEVVIVCPDTKENGRSHKITLKQPLHLRKVNIASYLEAYAVNGSPADCVKISMEALLEEKPDIVFSGVNIGAHVGREIYYSGLLAAAQEAGFFQVPFVSVSLDECRLENVNFTHVNQLFYYVADVILQHRMMKNIMLHVNLPCTSKEQCKGVAAVPLDLSLSRYNLHPLEEPHGEAYYLIQKQDEEIEAKEGTDYQMLKDGYITITPIDLKHTQKRKINQINNWFQGSNLTKEEV